MPCFSSNSKRPSDKNRVHCLMVKNTKNYVNVRVINM